MSAQAAPPIPQGAPALPFELQDSEEILVFCRRHWVFVWPRIAFYVLAASVPIIAAWLVLSWITGLGGPGGIIVGLVSLLWAVYWAVRSYFTWYRYHNDIWVVTNQRVVDSYRRHWFHHQMASADLVDVEDMRVEKAGFLSTVLNFGDVRCQTAGAQPNFILSRVPDPGNVLATVDAARDAARRELRGLR